MSGMIKEQVTAVYAASSTHKFSDILPVAAKESCSVQSVHNLDYVCMLKGGTSLQVLCLNTLDQSDHSCLAYLYR